MRDGGHGPLTLARVQAAEAALLLPTYDRHPLLFERGKGVYLYSADGKKYLDFLSGIGVNALGHAHPAIVKTIKKQAEKLLHVSNLFFHPYQSELAKKLTTASGLDRAFFCNSGTEAWEGALKLARAYANHVNKAGNKSAWRIIALENSFHGRTFGSLATTGQAKYRKPFAPGLPGVKFVKLNDVEGLKKAFDKTVCVIGLETIQGEGGIHPVSAEFLKTARDLTEKSGALLIVDEIQCGLGRTGKMFAYQHYGVRPDVVTVAKPIASGLPLGAILTTEEVSKAFHPGMHGTTFGGGPLACAVALSVLETIEKEKLLEHVNEMGEYFRKQIAKLDEKHACVTDVRGIGLMVGVELDDAEKAKAVVKGMMERGIIINRTHDTTLRFLPPFIIKKKHVDEVVNALDEVLTAVAKPALKAMKARAS
jgi:acetylornithine/N-succinyldiaminopimelate aminotransferase